MSEMTKYRNKNPGGLSPSTLPLGHAGPPQYTIVLRVDGGGGHFFSPCPIRSDRQTTIFIFIMTSPIY